MSEAVFDASVLVKLVISETGAPAAAQAFRALDCVLPDHAYLECANALWKKHRYERHSSGEVSLALDTLESIEARVIGLPDLVDDAFRLGLTLGHPIHDCVYLALAIREGLPLVTADARLRSVAAEADVNVVWIA